MRYCPIEDDIVLDGDCYGCEYKRECWERSSWRGGR